MIIVAIMAVLTAGWPLVNAAVANKQPLAAHSRLTVGSGAGSAAVVTVGPGWSMLAQESNPYQIYLLSRGAVELSILHVNLVNRNQVRQLWAGLRRILSVSDPGIRLGPPHVRTVHGLRAITGLMSSSQKVGTATIYPAPSRQVAVEMLVFAPRGTSAAIRAAASQIVSSLRFAVARQ
jgi:hypothetical protein